MTNAKCPTCGGCGLIHWHPHWDNGHMPCPACGGIGRASAITDPGDDKGTAPPPRLRSVTRDKQEGK